MVNAAQDDSSPNLGHRRSKRSSNKVMKELLSQVPKKKKHKKVKQKLVCGEDDLN
jgi:hypothetical protein